MSWSSRNFSPRQQQQAHTSVLSKTLDTIEGHIAPGAKAISLIKGVDVHGADIHIYADVIEKRLGISCSALSGANIASEVALEAFSETTVGYRNLDEGLLWQKLFETPKFRVQLIEDVNGVSLCGALKNVVAVAAGLSDGLGYGNNTKCECAVVCVCCLSRMRWHV